jgi:photosystem II stability/assembly factor-like uncharacterized protein
MPDIDFTGLGQAAEAAFKPHFADVIRRHARRQRRVRVAGAALAVTAVGAGGVAIGLPGDGAPGPGPGGGVVTTPPFVQGTPGPAIGKPPATGPVVVGDLDHLYVRWEDCRTGKCVLNVAATSDGGGTWRSHPLPVGADALVDLKAVGPRTLLVWSHSVRANGKGIDYVWHASVDGGASWRAVEVREVTAIPPGWIVLDGQPVFDGVLAADPAAGVLASLPRRPLALAESVTGLPPAAGLWVSGYAGTSTAPNGGLTGTGSVVEWSRDGGRTWQRHTFPEPVIATSFGNVGSVAIATDDGRTVYAVGRVGTALRIYRTGDGGRTWAATPARYEVGTRRIAAAMGPGGRLMIQAGPEHDQPAPLVLESLDGGATVRELPAGPGAAAVQVPGGYAQSGWPLTVGAWLSEDGLNWHYVLPPKVP